MTILKGVNGKKNGEKKAAEEERTVDYVEKGSSRFFGIKSYLHNFYDRGSKGVSPDTEEFYLLADPPKRRVVYTCRAALFVGMALLILGAIGIIAAHLWPQSRELTATYLAPEEFEFSTIDIWKMAGLIVFALGGMVIAVSLLIPLCCKVKWDRETAYDQIGDPVRVYPGVTSDAPPTYHQSYGSASPVKEIPTLGGAQPTLPVTEKLSYVQPKDDEATAGGGDMLLE